MAVWDSPPDRSRWQARRGTMVILGAVMMTLLAAFVAISVDLGYLNTVRTQLQLSADAAALAGADSLYDSPAYAQAQAESFGEINVVTNVPADIRPAEDIRFGWWDDRTLTFTQLDASDPRVDAVRVSVRRDAKRGNPINLFFARVLGVNTSDLSASAIAQAQNGLCGAIVGLESVLLEGEAYTDSYNLRDGAYDAFTAGEEGHVCSNGTINMNGQPTVHGNASTVEGQSVNLDGTATVTGRIQYRDLPVYAPPVIVGDATWNNNNDDVPLLSNGASPIDGSGNFNLEGGNNLPLPAGTYYFEDFRIGGEASLTVSGPTVIIVNGNLDAAGKGIINSTEVPSNLQIYVLGSTTQYRGDSDLYGVLYAPTSNVSVVGDSDIYGAVVGKTVKLSTTSTPPAGIHYEESLGLLLRARPRAFLVQ